MFINTVYSTVRSLVACLHCHNKRLISISDCYNIRLSLLPSINTILLANNALVSIVPVCFWNSISLERRETGEEDVGDDAEGPHVRHEGHRIVVDHLGSHELGGAAHHLRMYTDFRFLRGLGMRKHVFKYSIIGALSVAGNFNSQEMAP